MKKKNLYVGIKNQLLPTGVLELYFLDEIADSWNYDDWTLTNLVQDVINRVNAANPTKIIVWINSEGGVCDIGLALYSFLKYHKCSVETRVLALAGSIASVIMQAADAGLRFVAKTANVVIHEAWGYGMGRAEDMRRAADVMDGYTDTICGIYADVTGKPKDEIRELIRPGDYWMNGNAAVTEGYADSVFDEMPEGFEVNNCLAQLDPHYRNVPAELLATMEQTPPAPPNPLSNPQNQNMTFKERFEAMKAKITGKQVNKAAAHLPEEVADVLAEPIIEMMQGFSEDVTESVTAQLDSVQAAMTTAITASVTDAFKAELTALKDANTKLTNDLKAATDAHALMITELAELKGAESTNKPAGETTNNVVPIGRGTKLAKAAE